MLNVELDQTNRIAMLSPEGALSERDFEYACSVIDPYIEESGTLKGLIICTRKFPGWDSFGAMLEHFRFVNHHHDKISRVALVTDSALGDFADKLGGHFSSAKIKHFPFDELGNAQRWMLDA